MSRCFCRGIGDFLSKDDADPLDKSFSNITKNPITVVAVAALVHLQDKFLWGIPPKSCIPEVMALYGSGDVCEEAGFHGADPAARR